MSLVVAIIIAPVNLFSDQQAGYIIPPWAITIVPKKEKGKTITIRESIKDGVAYLPYIDEKQFSKNVSHAYNVAYYFVTTTSYQGAKRYYNGFSNHEIRELDLKNLINFTLMKLKRNQISFYRTEDQMTYPRYTIVWEKKGFFKVLRINQNNDNDAIAFIMMKGVFKKSRYFDQKTKQITERALMKGIQFIKREKTIYPHIEYYYISPSECSECPDPVFEKVKGEGVKGK